MQKSSWFPANLDEARWATVSAPPERVLEVSRGWAKDLGLVVIASDSSSTTFSFTSWSARWRGFKLRIATSVEKKGQTHVVFSPYTGNDFGGGVTEDMKRIADTFAARVCTEFANTGVEVYPEELGKLTEDRRRIRRRGHVYRIAYLVLAALVVPAAALGGVFGSPRYGTASVAALWTLLLMFWVLYARMRLLRAKSKQLFVVLGFVCAFALLGTLIILLVPPAQ